MCCEPVIEIKNLSKCYPLYDQPIDRLKQSLWRSKRQYFREFWALRDINFSVMPGEVVGIIGLNGSGKSTLLQLVCGILTPTSGEVTVKGRVAALLELGAGFNPEFSGRENVLINAAILGLSQEEISSRFDEIVDFSGTRDFIDRPVKTYSSGMYVRLAFSVAVNVNPDILVIDEALSVGDGIFARKSFERIMALKEAGKTILFCSHALYQVEAICNKVLWVDNGRALAFDKSADVVAQYNNFIGGIKLDAANVQPQPETSSAESGNSVVSGNVPHITSTRVSADGISGHQLNLESGKTDLVVEVVFSEPDALLPSSIGVVISGFNGIPLLSASSCNDGVSLFTHNREQVHVELCFPQLALLKGIYTVDVFLMCDKGIHVYEHIRSLAKLVVQQTGLEIGVVTLPHSWRVLPESS